MIEYTKENPLRCFYALAGYNSQKMALNRLAEHFPEFHHVCVGWSEIDANGEPIMNMGFEKPSKNARKITITVNGEQREYYSSQLIWKNKDNGISKTTQYKLAGNSICIAPMYHIFRKLFIEKECENEQLSLF